MSALTLMGEAPYFGGDVLQTGGCFWTRRKSTAAPRPREHAAVVQLIRPCLIASKGLMRRSKPAAVGDTANGAGFFWRRVTPDISAAIDPRGTLDKAGWP